MKDTEYDVVVIGGGIYGIMLALEASLRKLRVVVVERDEWGSGTTAGWLRILHGGLRYLQTLDLPRFYESVRERRWFLQHFPELMAPLPCVMPLYSRHSHPRMLMWAAMTLNDVLSMHRNRDVEDRVKIPGGSVMSKAGVVDALPFVETEGLRGGARWFDAIVLEPQQLLEEILEWAGREGAEAFEHTEAVRLLRDGKQTQGVEVRNNRSGESRELKAPVVVNMAGHWAPGFAGANDAPIENTPRLSWAWNVLFDVPYESTCAAAVSARRKGAQTFFMVPWKGKAMVGTGHALMPDDLPDKKVPDKLVAHFVEQVSEAVPGLNLSESKIEEVYQGVLPAANAEEMQLTSRPTIVDHRDAGSPGFYTVWGIKYTTARDIAKEILAMAFPALRDFDVTYDRPK